MSMITVCIETMVVLLTKDNKICVYMLSALGWLQITDDNVTTHGVVR